jgi:hypothetical protein
MERANIGLYAQGWDLFQQCVRCILSQWTVLRLAVSHAWGGAQSDKKAEELVRCILEVFDDVRNGIGARIN